MDAFDLEDGAALQLKSKNKGFRKLSSRKPD